MLLRMYGGSVRQCTKVSESIRECEVEAGEQLDLVACERVWCCAVLMKRAIVRLLPRSVY